MKPVVTDSQYGFRTYITDNFHQLEGSFYINSECIFCKNKLVNVLEIYDLLDFLDNGEFKLSEVKFWHANVKGKELKIFVFDINSGKILHRTHCLNDNTLPCDWLLIAKDYFKDDLLEFDF